MTEETAAYTPAKRQRLRQILFEKCFRHSSEAVFPLSSGVMSNYYIDCKMAFSYPEARALVGELILERIGNTSVDAVGGMAIGAYPIGIAVSDAAYVHSGRVIRAFVVRKGTKGHGLKKNIEGDVRSGDKILVVDDVITSGNSTIEAIAKIREEGLEVVHSIALIDRQESGGRKNIESAGVPFESLFTLQDLKALI